MGTTTKIIGFVLLMMSFTVLLGCCLATVYKVGDSDGWTAKKDTYYDWAEHKEFHVEDSLVFEYNHNFNDVTQVSGALEYEFCYSSSHKAVYNTGHDVVTLTKPGYHYFITSNLGQCGSGQKLDVLVVNDPSRPITQPPQQANDLPFGKIHIVDDSKGWSIHQESDLYYNWSQDKEFHVGDNLLFQYGQESNGVLEISGELEFISCDPTSPVAVHKTGHDLVRLTKPGVHYFISSNTGQCQAELKLRVVVGPIPNVPKLSPTYRLIKWLRTFIPHHDHH